MIKRWIVLLLLLFCSSAAVADDSAILKIVESSARAWLELLDNAKYRESWEHASPLLRSNKTEPEWVKSTTEMRSPLGVANARYIATAGAAKSLSGLPDGDYVVLQFYTTFAQKGLALETVTLAKAQNDSWLIADYSIK